MLPEVSCHHNCSFEKFQSANDDVETWYYCITLSVVPHLGFTPIVVDEGFVHNGIELPGLETLR